MPSQYTIVSLQNIDDEDFTFEYNASEGNPPYLMPAGDIVKYPHFIAKLALKHLIDKILNKRGERTNNQVLRDELANQIIVGEEKPSQRAQPTEAEKLRMEIDELNKPSTLDTILAKRKEEKTYKKKVKKAEEEKLEVGERFEGLEGVDTKTETMVKPVEDRKVVPPVDVKSKPTRNELYTFAEKEMNMVIDEKTKKKFAKMKIDTLITELQYPMED